MGLFTEKKHRGGIFQDPDFNAEITKRIRERLLHAMEAEKASAIVNNVTQNAHGGGGLMEHMGSPEDADYAVDIERRDLPEINPETGRPMGWTKKVTRTRVPKGG